MTITVYTTPDCGGCNLTIKVLESQKADFEVVDLSTDGAALQTVKQLGYSSAPVVVTDTDHWAGFRPDKLKSINR